MGIGYFPYLFDHSSFVNILSPLIPQLKQGNYQPLFDLAKKVLDMNPELWDTLYELNLGYSFAEEAEDLDPSSLLNKVVVRYLEVIDNIEEQNAWRMLRPTLPIIGWTETEISLLLYGKSLCSLLLPEEEYAFPKYRLFTNEEYSQAGLETWCRGNIGWLDIESIILFLDQLKQSKPDFYSLAQNPDRLVQKVLNHSDDVSLEWLTKRLLDSYRYTEQIFTVAYEANKSLALAIA